MIKNKEFYVLIEKDEDGYYIGEVPQLKACYSQGETIDELMENMKEVIEMCIEELEENNNLININEFIGVQKIRI